MLHTAAQASAKPAEIVQIHHVQIALVHKSAQDTHQHTVVKVYAQFVASVLTKLAQTKLAPTNVLVINQFTPAKANVIFVENA